MDLFETKILREFETSQLCGYIRDHGSRAWIRSSMSFLEERLLSQKGNYDKAARLLASSEWSRAGLNVLAYASLCFWHRPLAIPKAVFKTPKASWVANKRITDLACRDNLPQSEQVTWREVNHRLVLASVALKAVSLREILKQGEAWSFQAEMLHVLSDSIAENPYFIEINEKWPDYHTLCLKNKKDPRSKAFFKESFSSLDLKGVSKKAADVFCKVAEELLPNNFCGVKSVSTYFPDEGMGKAGCYGYRNGEGLLVLQDSFQPCMQTLPAFLAFVAHEVLHMHQGRSVEQVAGDPSRQILSPFIAECLVLDEAYQARNAACSTYVVQGRESKTHIPNRAYFYRPKEFLAYQFHDAFQGVLAKRMGVDYVQVGFDAGGEEFAREAGIKIELDQMRRPRILKPSFPSP